MLASKCYGDNQFVALVAHRSCTHKYNLAVVLLPTHNHYCNESADSGQITQVINTGSKEKSDTATKRKG